MQQRVFTVNGMTCSHCVNAVQSEVARIPGVSGVAVDLETARVTIDSAVEIDLAELRAAIEEAGYELAGPAAPG
jgi:copper ion binding protein